MTLRFTISRAVGLAVALSLVSAGSAAAQQSSARERRDERNRVRKEQQQPARDTATTSGTSTSGTTSGATTGTSTSGMSGGMTSSSGSMSGMGGEMGRVRDTVVVQCNCGSTTTAASGGEVLPLIRPRGPKLFGNGLYLGLSGASTLPVGDLYKAYSEGWGANGYVGWDHKASPVGLRLALGYNELNGRMPGPVVRRGLGRMDVINDFGGAGVDAREYNAAVNGKFRVPFGSFKGATSGVYAIAGGSVHHFRDYNRSLFLTNNFYGRGLVAANGEAGLINASNNESENITRFGWNAGAGASLGFGNTEIFVESSYNRVYTPGRAINYLPLVVGLQIH